jgi:hypothetical protein
MKLTKLSAAWLPGRACRLMPALARMGAGTASQLIPGVSGLNNNVRIYMIFNTMYGQIFILLFISFHFSFAKISLDVPDTLYLNTDYSLNSLFEDTTDSGYFADYWNWQLYVFDGSTVRSLEKVDSLYGYNNSIWTMRIDAIPDLFSRSSYINYTQFHVWIHGSYHKVYLGYIICFTDDNNNSYHSIIKEIKIIGEETTSPIGTTDVVGIDPHSHPGYIHENASASFRAVNILDDFIGSDSYTEFWNWRLFIFHTNGLYILAKADSLPSNKEGIYLYTCEWNIDIDEIPNNYTWITDSSGQILSFLTVNTTDIDSVYFSIIEKLILYENSTSIINSKNDPGCFTLFQNYPNPFNPTTKIEYSLNQPSNVEIEIFNQLGQRIKKYYEGKKLTGNYSVTWHGFDENNSKVASGVYYYRIKAGEHIQIRKMVLIK